MSNYIFISDNNEYCDPEYQHLSLIHEAPIFEQYDDSIFYRNILHALCIYKAKYFKINNEEMAEIMTCQNNEILMKYYFDDEYKNNHNKCFRLFEKNWKKVQSTMIKKIIKLKYNQYPYLHELLLLTGDKDLLYIGPYNDLSAGKTQEFALLNRGVNRNLIGAIWMIMRDKEDTYKCLYTDKKIEFKKEYDKKCYEFGEAQIIKWKNEAVNNNKNFIVLLCEKKLDCYDWAALSIDEKNQYNEMKKSRTRAYKKIRNKINKLDKLTNEDIKIILLNPDKNKCLLKLFELPENQLESYFIGRS